MGGSVTHKEYREKVNNLAASAADYIDERRTMDTMIATPRWTDPMWLRNLTHTATKVQTLESQIRVYIAEIKSAPLKLKP